LVRYSRIPWLKQIPDMHLAHSGMTGVFYIPGQSNKTKLNPVIPAQAGI